MSATDTFTLQIKGKGGHGAQPDRCIDAVLVAAHIITALQTIVAREISPLQAAVITVGTIQAGSAPNVIADTAVLSGTVRAFDESIRQYLEQRLTKVAEDIAIAMRATCSCEYIRGNAPVINDSHMTNLVTRAAVAVVGQDRVSAGEPIMWGEDFAWFLKQVPGCFFFIGTRNEKRGIIGSHHNPRFDIDEMALPLGVTIFVKLAESYLNEE